MDKLTQEKDDARARQSSSDAAQQSMESDGILEIDTLRQFTIPKRKKAKRGKKLECL